jgi:hypothetical protein
MLTPVKKGSRHPIQPNRLSVRFTPCGCAEDALTIEVVEKPRFGKTGTGGAIHLAPERLSLHSRVGRPLTYRSRVDPPTRVSPNRCATRASGHPVLRRRPQRCADSFALTTQRSGLRRSTVRCGSALTGFGWVRAAGEHIGMRGQKKRPGIEPDLILAHPLPLPERQGDQTIKPAPRRPCPPATAPVRRSRTSPS